MNRHYVYDEETPTMTTQRDSNWLAAAGLLLLLVIGALAMLFVTYKAVAQSQPNTATITFSPSTTYTDGTPYPSNAVVSYSLWQGLKGAPRVKVGAFTSGGSVTTGLLTGNEYCWDVTTVVSIGGVATESAHSLAACKKFDGVPTVVVITVT